MKLVFVLTLLPEMTLLEIAPTELADRAPMTPPPSMEDPLALLPEMTL
jgi:hypothetical protein